MNNISEHITFDEATLSPTAKRLGIDNTPDQWETLNMQIVAMKCFEPMRKWWGRPLKVNSFYRCPALNKQVGGAETSQHTKGEAIDIGAGSREDNLKLYEWAKSNLIFDQLIYEYGDDTGPDWVHISFKQGQNRNQTLRVK